MLMDILMEALMSMDEDTLDSVLESCDAEELEIIDDMVMERTFFDDKGNPRPTEMPNKDAMKLRVRVNLGRNLYSRTHKIDDAPSLDPRVPNEKQALINVGKHILSKKKGHTQNKSDSYNNNKIHFSRAVLNEKISNRPSYERRDAIKAVDDQYKALREKRRQNTT